MKILINTLTYCCIITLFSACVPSLSRLQAYENVQSVSEMGILVLMPEAFKEHDSISSLYGKYGYDKKAEKYKEEKRKQEIWIKTAFLEKFKYCKVYYDFDSIAIGNTDYVISFLESEKMTNSTEHGIFEKVLTLRVNSNNPKIELSPLFPNLIESNSRGYTLNNYRYLASELNRRLCKMREGREKIKEKRPNLGI